MELKNVTIKSIDDLKTFPGSEFTCVEFTVTTSEEYPQTLKLQANKEKAANLIKFNKVGDSVDVSINLKGREWVNKEGKTVVFNTIEAWKVFKAEGVETPAFEPSGDLKDEEDHDDLPF